MRDRDGRKARKDAHSVERDHGVGPGRVEPGLVGASVIQITPQMKILVAIEAVDGRKGIDSLTRLCEEKLQSRPSTHAGKSAAWRPNAPRHVFGADGWAIKIT